MEVVVVRDVIRPTRQDLFFFRVPEPSDEFVQGKLPIWIDHGELKIAYASPDLGNGVKLGLHRLPGTENVWLVGRGSGHGSEHAPAVAKYVTDALSGGVRSRTRFSFGEKLDAVSGRVL